ncbi:DUF6056 family protein [[Collinsella] massiliensis]|uniref:Glycosyltransferase RgtA/B/C/D-like domain-containing protein n=1 Tax=[Collinsella] massiliensis TaxID=1232426 RepID=A0A1Y3XNV1_9ACTN|nr:DUF6056 family protein [[Collinsella] massiliensis]OUN87195.1 hypothetical protein B5G02_07560 [[Collinsella] massiliensis]
MEHGFTGAGECAAVSGTGAAGERWQAGRHLRRAPRPADPIAVLAVGLAVLLALALIPMLAISRYDHSYADDWHYGVDAHAALEAGEGLPGAVAAAVTEAADTYSSWQGTYSAIVLMALQPGVFGEGLYGLGAVGIIAALVLATGYAASVVVRDVCGAGRAEWLCVACAALLLQTQLLPSPVEGFWWYNSAIYYTFYHALLLVGAGLAVRLLRGRTRRGALTGPGMAARSAALVLLAFVIGGGNYVTGLVAVVALAGAVVAALARGRRSAWLLVPALAVLAVGFACSMAAPGNVERQLSQFAGDNLGVVPTLARSALAGFEYALLWTNGFMVLALALLLPVFARIARRSRCSFALPGAPAIALALLFMASFAPTFFSMGTVGPGRVQNIRYDFFVAAVLLCAGWLTGWVVRRLERREACRAQDGATAAGARPFPRRRALAAHLGCCVLVLVMAVASLAVDERHRDDLVSISAATSLISGEAREYDEQVRARLAYLEESEEGSVDVAYYTAAPKVLFMGDIRDNMDNYINYRLAQWYGKESIIGYHAVLS